MKSFPFILTAALLAAICSSCITNKTLQSEKAMEDWLSQAQMPVYVEDQSYETRCRPTLNCYTLIDASGQIHYARNVRHALPRVIPVDSTRLRQNWIQQLLGGTN